MGRKQPKSYVGKVRSRDFEELEDEDDVPTTRGISSVVNVQGRRYGIPIIQEELTL